MRRSTLVLVMLVAAVLATYLFFFSSNVQVTEGNEFVYIRHEASFDDLVDSLNAHGQLKNETKFRQWASWLSFQKPRSGRFKLSSGLSSYALVRLLQRGEQSPVKVVLTDEKTPQEVAAKAARFIMADSAAIATILADTAFLAELGYSPHTIMTVFLPDTYQMYWNTTADGFVKRMKKEHDKFWTEERRAKAAAQGMDIAQAYTMASIVDGETNIRSEMPEVAGLYLNRLKTGMKLQADPTVQYALSQSSGGGPWRRLSYADYSFQHPYNTYVITGLPPGPVMMPSKAAIEAVLSPAEHEYIYMVAKPETSGAHTFSKTLSEHNTKAKIFTEWLNSQSK